MFQPLDYTFEIILLLGTAVLLLNTYMKYFKVDKNADGDKLLAKYLELKKAKNGKKL